MIADENTAGPLGSSAGQVALDSITRLVCGAQRRYGARSALSRSAEAETLTACRSVFWAVRPRPGKCLRVACTPADCRPAANWQAAAAARPGAARKGPPARNQPGCGVGP